MIFSEAGMFLAEKSQGLRHVPLVGEVYRLGRRKLHGSDSPSWAEPNYYRVGVVATALGYKPMTAMADPEAGRHHRHHEHALILGTDELAIKAIMHLHRKNNPKHAVAYWDNKDIVRAGVLDNGFGYYFPDEPDEGPPLLAAAMRQGQNPYEVALGVLSGDRLIIPRNGRIIAQNIPISELPTRYPRVPLT